MPIPFRRVTSRVVSGFFLAAFLVAWSACFHPAAGSGSADAGPKNTIEFKFFGQPYRWVEPGRGTAEPASWAELGEVSEKEGKSVALALADIAKKYPLDDFGKLMLLRELAMRIPLSTEMRRSTFHGAWQRGRWDDTSRAIFVAAQLNLAGFRAVVFTTQGRAMVGLPVVDPELNSRTESIVAARTFLGQTKEISRRYLMWDVQGRLGDPAVPQGESELVTPLQEILNRDEGKFFDFRTRTIPQAFTTKRQPGMFNWPGGRAVGYKHYPDIARYLELYPEHDFNTQVRLERAEAKRLGLGPLVATFATGSEELFVSQMLQAVQSNFTYTQGGLRSVHEILLSGQGDCDQLALVLALLLLESGYSESALASVLWQDADHLGLALRPKQAGLTITGAARFQFDSDNFYVLDPTYYHKRETELITAWGEMNPENLPRKATVFRMAGGK